MNSPDPLFQSLHRLHGASDAVQIDVADHVLRTIQDRSPQAVLSRGIVPTAAVLASIVAITVGALAMRSYNSASDPVTSMLSATNVSLQW